MADQIIVAWLRQKELTNNEHLLNGYFDLKSGEDSSIRTPFSDKTYAKLMGEFARLARGNPKAVLYVLRLDQTPQAVAMKIEPAMAKLLREDPVRYIKATSPPARVVKLKIEDDATPNKVKENLHGDAGGEPWQQSPAPGGYDTVAESFGDDIFCKVSGNLIECPSCGRWAATKPLEDGVHLQCPSCLFEDVLTLLVTPKRTWALLPTEALLQNEAAHRGRFYIPRTWNKGGPWIKTEELSQRFKSFCKERNDASEHR